MRQVNFSPRTMPDKWGLSAMSHVNDPGNTTQDAFTVVVNGAGQYSLWRASADPPAGWLRRSAVMPRRACLDAIADAWQDIAPSRARVRPGPEARFVRERFAGQ